MRISRTYGQFVECIQNGILRFPLGGVLESSRWDGAVPDGHPGSLVDASKKLGKPDWAEALSCFGFRGTSPEDKMIIIMHGELKDSERARTWTECSDDPDVDGPCPKLLQQEVDYSDQAELEAVLWEAPLDTGD